MEGGARYPSGSVPTDPGAGIGKTTGQPGAEDVHTGLKDGSAAFQFSPKARPVLWRKSDNAKPFKRIQTKFCFIVTSELALKTPETRNILRISR